jgi:hypothetical protein
MSSVVRFTLGSPRPGDPACRATIIRLGRRGQVWIVAARDFLATSEAVRWSRGIEREQVKHGLACFTLFGRPGDVIDRLRAQSALRALAPRMRDELRRCCAVRGLPGTP